MLEEERLFGGTGGRDAIVTPLGGETCSQGKSEAPQEVFQQCIRLRNGSPVHCLSVQLSQRSFVISALFQASCLPSLVSPYQATPLPRLLATLTRMKAKGSSVVRARKWRLQARKPPVSIGAPASALASSGLTPASPGRLLSIPTAPPPASRDGDETASNRLPSTAGTEDHIEADLRCVNHPTGSTPTRYKAAYQQCPLPCSRPAATPRSAGVELLSASDGQSIILKEGTSAPSYYDVESPVAQTSRQSLRQKSRQTSRHSTGPASFKHESSTAPESPALAAALACARGIGGRLGTPLGSPYPAPGNDWATGRSASASARAGARTDTRSGGGVGPSALGSRFFPPFALVSAGALGATVSAPVVLEMVQDAAEDEEDVATDNGAAGRGAGWHGLMLYRWAAQRT